MSKKEKEEKTNAIRLMALKKIPYTLHRYDAPDGFLDGVTVAKETGQDPAMVFKTLVLVGSSRENYVCVIPVEETLNLKKAAKHFREKYVEMIHAKDLLSVTGYKKGGCSPVGMKKPLRTAIHITALSKNTVCVSGGKVGLQVEIDPRQLAALVGGDFVDLV